MIRYSGSMLLADATPVTGPIPSVVLTLDGVTTVLVLFIFVCLTMPALVKNRSQFYMALAAIVGIIVLHTLSLIFDTSTFIITLVGVVTGLLQVVGMVLLVLCVGGLTAKELAGDMARAYEVLRRGETEKELIIPIGDQPPRRAKAAAPEASRKVYKVDSGPVKMDDDEDKGIPLS